MLGEEKSNGRDPDLPGSQHMDMFTSGGNCQLRPAFLHLISDFDDGEMILFSDEKLDSSCMDLKCRC